MTALLTTVLNFAAHFALNFRGGHLIHPGFISAAGWDLSQWKTPAPVFLVPLPLPVIDPTAFVERSVSISGSHGELRGFTLNGTEIA